MRKPVLSHLTALTLLSGAILPGMAQQLLPAIGSQQNSTTTRPSTQAKANAAVRSQKTPGVGGAEILTDPTLIRGLGEGLDPSGKSILPAGSPGSATAAPALDNLLYDNANGTTTPVFGGATVYSNNSTLGSATDLLLNTQAGVPTPKIPLSSIAATQLTISVDPTEVALDNMRGVQLSIANHTDRPVLIDGTLASVTIGKDRLCAATMNQIELVTCPPVTRKELIKRFVATAVTVGAVPTIADQKIQDGPIRNRYGCDEARRTNDIAHFGKRVLWPGDSTGGVLFFNTRAPLKGLSIQLPVSTLFVNSDGALLTILP